MNTEQVCEHWTNENNYNLEEPMIKSWNFVRITLITLK